MASSETVSVRLRADVAAALEHAVSAGEYESLDEAIGDAVATWARRHEDRAEEMAWVKAKINAAIDDPRPGLSLERVEAHMEAVFANARKRRDAAA